MEWINIKDKNPPKDKPFLAHVLVGFYFNGKDRRKKEINTVLWDDFNERYYEYCNCSGMEFDREYIEVTHWMPIPELPKDELESVVPCQAKEAFKILMGLENEN